MFAADGTPVGSEILVNTATASGQSDPQITALSNGGFVVTWKDGSQGVGGATGDSSGSAMKAQVFAADGRRDRLGNPGQHRDGERSGESADHGAVERRLRGDVGGLQPWRRRRDGGHSERAVKAQVFAADGTRVGSELLVNTATASRELLRRSRRCRTAASW